MIVITCAKYKKNPSRTVDATEWTRFWPWRYRSRSKVIVCDTPSHGSDHLWLIWKESIQNCRCYRADTAGGTDGRTDGRTDGVKPIYPPTTSLFGGYKYYWYGSIILPTFVFSFDCSVKIWHTRSYVVSIMHSTRTFVITVSNNRVSCSPHLGHIAAAVIVTRAHCSLTAADHCYIILGTIKFVDKSVKDNSTHRLDHCDVIASCREVQCAAQWSWTSNWI